MPDRNRVDHFVIVGAQRCGTTYLSRLLDAHPEIEMAKPLWPEPKFFLDDDRYALGLEYYESEFFPERGTRVRGEKSTSYIESEVAAGRITATLPGAPLLVVVRDPVRRAISNYRFSAEHGVEDLPIPEALRPEAGNRAWDHARFSVSPFAYLARGRYVEYLERLSRCVAPELIRVLVFEELVNDETAIAGIYALLGVDETFRPAEFGSAVNASTTGDQPVGAEIEARLRDYFREPNQRLEEFLGRSLPWPSAVL
jgi:hypothetical protein